MENLVLVGVSHHTAPIEVRERLAFPQDQVGQALQQLCEQTQVPEGLIVSTCNRVELIANGPDGIDSDHAAGRLRNFIRNYHELSDAQLDGHLYTLQQRDVIRHVFRVASSLDSMVVGEPQILAQLKEAYRCAHRAGSLGRSLNNLIPRAFFVAKRVRTETGIGRMAVSISSVAVDLANKIFGALDDKKILMLGAGKMGELAARSFISSGASRLFVANRTPATAAELAERLHGRSVPFEQMNEYLVETDIVLVSTGARNFVLTRETLQRVVRQRRYRPLFVIDISVPRNVEPAVNQIANVFLYDIDDLQSVVRSNLDGRLKQAELAEAIIEQEVEKYVRRLSLNQTGPLIAGLRRRLEEICLMELDRHSGHLDPEHHQLIEEILKRTAHRVAHPLIARLKDGKLDPDRRLHNQELIRQAFKLDEES